MTEVVTAWADGAVDPSAIDRAAASLASHGVVGLPTETVYGLAACATDAAAVARVFAIKGRPIDHPVIMHVGNADALTTWGRTVPPYARLLASALWPGPLTLVVEADEQVPRYVTGGQDTVALRCPAHPVALALIEASGPLAAPSANRFGRVSPTSAADVLADLGDAFGPADLILDGGDCPVGVESTILDCTGTQPRLLRSGAVEPSDVRRITDMEVLPAAAGIRAPGSLASHYAPSAAVHTRGVPVPGSGLIAPAAVPTPPDVVRLAAPASTRDYAAAVYRALRDADAQGLSDVWALPPDDGSALAEAVRDRLTRASVRT